jgi:hypothetical protein
LKDKSRKLTEDADIEKLKLTKIAKEAAYQLKQKYPATIFTSGLRTTEEQAYAMAENIVKSNNRNWIKETYSDSEPIRKLQKWVDENQSSTTKEQIGQGLESVMNSMSKEDLLKISKHLTGDAFDVQPTTTNAVEIKKYIQNLPGLKKFLDEEGGLVRWHAQFK